MRHPTYDEETVRTGLRLPVSLHEKLKAEAEARVVSVNLLVNRAIEAFLDDPPDGRHRQPDGDELAEMIRPLRASASYEKPSIWRRLFPFSSAMVDAWRNR